MMVKIRYSPEETGWAENLGEGKYRIANIPLSGDLNIDDVVTCNPPETCDCCPEVDEILTVAYQFKVAVKYEPGLWDDVHKSVHAVGARIEGMVEGVALVAYKEEHQEALAKLESTGLITCMREEDAAYAKPAL